MASEMAPAVEHLMQGFGLTRTVANWIVARDIPAANLQRFLEPRLGDLTLPDAMADRDIAARRLAAAVRNQELVVVFGDYDCDGITATAILTQVLRSVGGLVEPMLASRYAGGYGVSPPAVARILAANPRVLVTCDCGSSDHETLGQVRAAGVDVIVIDHHLVPDRPLPAIAFLNPHRPECGFPYKGLASCGLCLSIAAALRRELNVSLDIRAWLDLVAIGTIADVAPLSLDNRILVRHGLTALRAATRPGIAALFELAKISREAPLSGRDIAFRIAPLINAPGRLGDPELALRLLLSEDAATAKQLAAEVFAVSTRRRELQQQMLQEAEAQIDLEPAARGAALVVGSETWSHGIVGIAAGRLADKYAMPTVVLAYEGERALGSVRGPKGARLHDMVSSLAELLTRFGGHQAALGLELRREHVALFRERLCAAVTAFPSEPARESAALELMATDEPAQVLSDLMRLEPCGEGNPRPALSVSGTLLHASMVTGGHLKLSLSVGSQKLSGFAPSQGHLAASLSGAITVVGDLRHNYFQGVARVEMLVERVLVTP